MLPELILYSVGALSAVSLSILMFLSAFTDIYSFWPPEERNRDQLIYWTLASVNTISVLFLGFAQITYFQIMNTRILTGLSLFSIGLLITIIGIQQLGFRRTSGIRGPLVQRGLYGHSRNPQVVGNMLSIVGLGIMRPEIMYMDLLLLTISWLFNMVFAEERWMKDNYGEEYSNYLDDTSRFF